MYATRPGMKDIARIDIGTPAAPSDEVYAFSFGISAYENLCERAERIEERLGANPSGFSAYLREDEDTYHLTTMVEIEGVTPQAFIVNEFLDQMDSLDAVLERRTQEHFKESAAHLRDQGMSIRKLYGLKDAFLDTDSFQSYVALTGDTLIPYTHPASDGTDRPHLEVPLNTIENMVSALLLDGMMQVDFEHIKTLQCERYQQGSSSTLDMYRKMVREGQKSEMNLITPDLTTEEVIERLDDDMIREHFPFTSEYDTRFLAYHVLGENRE